MTLREWLTKTRTSGADLAREMGVDRSAVVRWCKAPGAPGARCPRPEAMARILHLTRGKVRPIDFVIGAVGADQ